MPKKPKPARKTKNPTATIPAWTCPKCGATHPITVPTCCKPAADAPLPNAPKPPDRVRPLGPYECPIPWSGPIPLWWSYPPDITCTVHPSAGPDYQNPGFREVQS